MWLSAQACCSGASARIIGGSGGCMCLFAPSLSPQGRGPHGSSPWAALRGGSRPAPFRRSGTPTAENSCSASSSSSSSLLQLFGFFLFFALVCWRRSWALREHLLDSLSGSVLISECCSPIDYSISFWSISFLKRADVKWSVLIYDKVFKGYILLWICHSIIYNA